VQELTVGIRDDPAVVAGVAVEADVRVNIAFGGFVLDLSAELHCAFSLGVKMDENVASN